jgi:hypothetical protein
MVPSVHDRGGPALSLLELGHANWRVTELVAATLLVGVTAVMSRWTLGGLDACASAAGLRSRGRAAARRRLIASARH